MQFSAFLCFLAFTDLVKKLLSYNPWAPNGDRIAFHLPGKPLLAFITVHNCRACQRAVSIPAHWADQGWVCCANNNPAAALQTAGAKWDNGLCQAFEFIRSAWCLRCSMTSCLSFHARFPYELDALWGLLAVSSRQSMPLERLAWAPKDELFRQLHKHLWAKAKDTSACHGQPWTCDESRGVSPWHSPACCSLLQCCAAERAGTVGKGILSP